MSTLYTNISKISTPYQGSLSKLKVQVLDCTPEMAKILRSTSHFERQRPIDKNNVDRLSLEMKRGWFIAGTPIFVCVLPDGSMRIVNGNHTLEAVTQSEATVPLTFIYSQVSSIEDAAQIYANMDIQKIRTWANALQAVRPDTTAFQAKVLSALGIVIYEFSSSSTARESAVSKSRTHRFALLSEYQSAADLLASAIHDGPKEGRKFVSRAPIMAVALATFRYQPSTAHEFWNGLVFDNGLKSNDPRKALLNFLRNNTSGGSGMRHVAFRAAALCWNAFFEGRELTLAKPGAMNTFYLTGTPWHRQSGGGKQQLPQTASKPLFETGFCTTENGAHGIARFVA